LLGLELAQPLRPPSCSPFCWPGGRDEVQEDNAFVCVWQAKVEACEEVGRQEEEEGSAIDDVDN
tara:strand:+ start:1321 stop:1512 length:192 start_codon:yes stop_codon:yes gene_type:complete